MASIVQIGGGRTLHALEPDGFPQEGIPLHPDANHAEAHPFAGRNAERLPAHERGGGDGGAHLEELTAREAILRHVASLGRLTCMLCVEGEWRKLPCSGRAGSSSGPLA